MASAVGNGELWVRSDGLRWVLVLALRGATRQPAGGGRGGKLDGRDDGGTTDGEVENGCTAGRIKDEGISTDDVAGGGNGVSSGLHFDRGVRMSTCGDVAEEFSMAGPGFVAASCL